MRGPRAAPLPVVVVEGSKTQRSLLRRVLEAEGDIAVVGEAATAADVLAAVREAKPKVVTMDLQIDGGGIEAIAALMKAQPLPILVLSVAVQGAWSTRAVDALAAGATEVLPKPVKWDRAAEALVRERVRAIAAAGRARPPSVAVAASAASAPAATPGERRAHPRVVALAASTGGPAALASVVAGLGGVPAAVVVVQHLHADFTEGFVAWLDKASPLPVKAAAQGERLKAGTVYVAPGDQHLRVGSRCTAVLDRLPEAIHRPSADELFRSMASSVGAAGIGVLLTGMGADGAVGLAAMRAAGALTIAQDKATSVVYGMPRAAVLAGAVDRELPLPMIAEAVRTAVARGVPGRR